MLFSFSQVKVENLAPIVVSYSKFSIPEMDILIGVAEIERRESQTI
jgi:hypothetical protein